MKIAVEMNHSNKPNSAFQDENWTPVAICSSEGSCVDTNRTNYGNCIEDSILWNNYGILLLVEGNNCDAISTSSKNDVDAQKAKVEDNVEENTVSDDLDDDDDDEESVTEAFRYSLMHIKDTFVAMTKSSSPTKRRKSANESCNERDIRKSKDNVDSKRRSKLITEILDIQSFPLLVSNYNILEAAKTDKVATNRTGKGKMEGYYELKVKKTRKEKTKSNNSNSHFHSNKCNHDVSYISLYNRGFALNIDGRKTKSSHSEFDEEEYVQSLSLLIGSTVLYNLALTYHCMGIHIPSSTKYMIRALHLYKLSYRLLQQKYNYDHDDDNCTDREDCVYDDWFVDILVNESNDGKNVNAISNVASLLLAIFNNIAHVSASLHDNAQTYKSLQQLQKVLDVIETATTQSTTFSSTGASYPSSYNIIPSSSIRDNDGYAIFVLNAMILLVDNHVLSIASAAA